VVFFLEIDNISKVPAAISDATRGVNRDISLQQHPLDVRQGPKTIVTLDLESMLRTCHCPPQLLGKLNEGIGQGRRDRPGGCIVVLKAVSKWKVGVVLIRVRWLFSTIFCPARSPHESSFGWLTICQIESLRNFARCS
jgi:hypothetical protein